MVYTPGIVNRRQFITYGIVTALGVVAITTRTRYRHALTADRPDLDDGSAYAARVDQLIAVVGDETEARLLALVPDLDSAVAIGVRPRTADAERSDESAIAARLSDRLLGDPRTADEDPEAIRARFDAIVEQEFVEDRLVLVDGWLVSATRADLYHLAALVHDRTGRLGDVQ